MKVIELPQVDGDLYCFDELPGLIAGALHPEARYCDVLISYTIWRDVGPEGAYFCCMPPSDQCCVEFGDGVGWSIRSILLSEDEQKNPELSSLGILRRNVQQLPAKDQAHLPDGSLILSIEWASGKALRNAEYLSEFEWYQLRLYEAAVAKRDDPAKLRILDSRGNDFDGSPGSSTSYRTVRLVELNRWGAMEEPPRSFFVRPMWRLGSSNAPVEQVIQKASKSDPAFPIKRAALVAAYKRVWPSIEADLKYAKDNGLSAAKFGARGWLEQHAVKWARSKNKIFDQDTPVANLDGRVRSMQALPTTRHLFKR